MEGETRKDVIINGLIHQEYFTFSPFILCLSIMYNALAKHFEVNVVLQKDESNFPINKECKSQEEMEKLVNDLLKSKDMSYEELVKLLN